MSPPLSEVSAANMALAHLGEPPLASLDENRTAAIAVRSLFDPARDEMLRMHPWNFAIRRIVPARDPAASPGQFVNVFPLPSSTLRVLSVAGLAEDSWAVETRGGVAGESGPARLCLVTDAIAPAVSAVVRVVDPALWDISFTACFALHLARLVAPQLGQRDRVDELTAEMDRRLMTARRVDAREAARSAVGRAPSFVTARW